MAFPWSAIVSAGGSLLGGLVSARGAERASERSEDFSREMYQYALLNGPSFEMEGLRRAGINPMLRYGTGGQGTPVSMPTMSFPNQYGGLGEAITGGTASAFGAMRTEQEIEESRSRVQNMTAEWQRIVQDTNRIVADTSLTQQQRNNALAEQGRIVQQTALGAAEEYLRYAQANLSEAQQAQAGAMVRLLGQELSTEEQRTLLTQWQASVAEANAQSSWLGLPRERIDSEIYRSALGTWLREAFLSREATGSGLVGAGVGSVGLAAEGLSGFMDWYEQVTRDAANEVFRWFE